MDTFLTNANYSFITILSRISLASEIITLLSASLAALVWHFPIQDQFLKVWIF
jgi:hypothetical protein